MCDLVVCEENWSTKRCSRSLKIQLHCLILTLFILNQNCCWRFYLQLQFCLNSSSKRSPVVSSHMQKDSFSLSSQSFLRLPSLLLFCIWCTSPGEASPAVALQRAEPSSGSGPQPRPACRMGMNRHFQGRLIEGPLKFPQRTNHGFHLGPRRPARGQRGASAGPLKRGKWQEDVEQLWDLEHKSAHGDSFMQKWAILSQTASVQSPCRCFSTTLQRYICIYVVSRWPVPLQVSSWLVRCFKLEGWSN